MVRTELFLLSCAPPSPPPSRRPRSSPRCRRSSLPFTGTQSLRTDRPPNPQRPAPSSPRRHCRRRSCRHCRRTSSAPKSQIPAWTGSPRRQPSSAGFRPAAATERSVSRPASPGCKASAARARRAVPAPVPRGRSATCVLSAPDRISTCPSPRAPPARSSSPLAPPQSETAARDRVARALAQDSWRT